jgi:hypothetical protein
MGIPRRYQLDTRKTGLQEGQEIRRTRIQGKTPELLALL